MVVSDLGMTLIGGGALLLLLLAGSLVLHRAFKMQIEGVTAAINKWMHTLYLDQKTAVETSVSEEIRRLRQELVDRVEEHNEDIEFLLDEMEAMENRLISRISPDKQVFITLINDLEKKL